MNRVPTTTTNILLNLVMKCVESTNLQYRDKVPPEVELPLQLWSGQVVHFCFLNSCGLGNCSLNRTNCGSLENVDPNESISGNNSSNEKKLELPSEFFELLGDAEGKKARMYRCLFEGCKMKVKKYGTQKPLIVFNDTRFNAKRHYLVVN
ncbi:hypothetical protein OUZ56_005322 [Daphnia magna]|uniref:Uncharacterized protein n=1 Tax=Daphnia magna TaxID=35525 RepID=A0ABQ9YSU3_9CRUS|nr:hypothetical protein OUZ56_005322 [Daphnia magna]